MIAKALTVGLIVVAYLVLASAFALLFCANCLTDNPDNPGDADGR